MFGKTCRSHLEAVVEFAVLWVHRLRAQLVNASEQGYPEIVGEALPQVLEDRDQRGLQENPGVVEVDRAGRQERHGGVAENSPRSQTGDQQQWSLVNPGSGHFHLGRRVSRVDALPPPVHTPLLRTGQPQAAPREA